MGAVVSFQRKELDLGTQPWLSVYSHMKNEYQPENPRDKTGNEPAPLLMIAVAVVPLLGVAGWFIFG